MAALRKIEILSNKLFINNIRTISTTAINNVVPKFLRERFDIEKPSEYAKFMPGYYPETEEERIKAAEKYGMHPDEYKPFPNDYRHQGDYPDLPWISYEAKDPYYPYDYPFMRRNYNEPVHYYFNVMGPDRYDYGVRYLIGRGEGILLFIATITVFLILHHISPNTTMPRMKKQYPRDGVHYTFEPAK